MTGTQPTEQSSTSFTLRPLATSTPAAELRPGVPADPVAEGDKAETPIDMFEAKWGRTFLADLYDMSGLGDFAKEELSQVDTFILSEIKDRGLNPTKQSYQALLAELESKLDLNPNLKYDVKLQKLRSYVEIIQRQKSLDLRRKILEHGR